MNTVQTILGRKGNAVHSVTEGASVLDAAKLMNERRVGALVVTRGDKVVGIFTERDVLNRIVAQQRDPAHTEVGEVMTTPVACCTPKTPCTECGHVMREKRVRHLPVVDGERLVGIVSIGDIVEDEGAQQQETIRYLHEYMHGEWH